MTRSHTCVKAWGLPTNSTQGSGKSQEKGLIVQDKIARNGTAENLSCLPTFENLIMGRCSLERCRG